MNGECSQNSEREIICNENSERKIRKRQERCTGIPLTPPPPPLSKLQRVLTLLINFQCELGVNKCGNNTTPQISSFYLKLLGEGWWASASMGGVAESPDPASLWLSMDRWVISPSMTAHWWGHGFSHCGFHCVNLLERPMTHSWLKRGERWLAERSGLSYGPHIYIRWCALWGRHRGARWQEGMIVMKSCESSIE